MELPGLARLYEDYGDDYLQVLALNVVPGYGQEAYLRYMRSLGGGDHLYATDTDLSIARSYQIRFLGETVIIDREGRIAGRAFTGLSYKQLQEIVEPLLA